MVELSERYSDNAALVPSAAAQSDWITDVAAGLRVDYLATRANALLDYRVNRLRYSRQPAFNDTRHRLNANATLEAVEKWMFLDARASITQQNRSAFGPAGIAESPSTSANRIETATYQIAPYVRGSFADVATYQLRVNGAETRTGDSAFPDTRTYQWNGFVKNAPSAGRLGWSVVGNGLSVDNSVVGTLNDTVVRGTVTWEADPQLHVTLSAGRESSDLDGAGKRNTNSPGIGIEWSPSQRTQMAAVAQKRFFGNDYLVAIAHRTPLVAWRISSAREIAVSTGEIAGSNTGSVNDLLLGLLASTLPDPVARAEATQRRFEQTGIPALSGIQEGYLTVRPFLSRRIEVSVAMRGLRNTFTLAVGRREQRAFDAIAVAPAGGAPIEEIRQFGANAAWAYRLSPVSTMRMELSHFRNVGLFSENLTSTQRLQSLFFVTQVGTLASVSLGLRRVSFESTVATNYRENAFVSSLSLRF